VKRTTAIIVLTVFSLAVLLPFSLNAQTVLAQDESYTIQRVDHQVEVMYSGHVVIRDTISVTGQLTDFLIGFPHKYGSYVLKGVAYDDNTNVFPVSLGVQLGDRSGFYGAKISFPQGSPQVFTVAFILSNSLVSQDSNEFSLDFPAYPSLVKDAATCHSLLALPEAVQNITITKDDGTVQATNFIRANLPAYTYSSAIATFPLSAGSLQIININNLDRQVKISPMGDIAVSDCYRIKNNSTARIGSLKISLPLDAANVVARDEFGRNLATDVPVSSGNTRFVNVTLTSPLNSGASTRVSADYTLPSASSGQTTRFTLNFDLFSALNCYVDEATVKFVPPEGAKFLEPQLSSLDPSSSLIREIFQETLSINREGVSNIDYAIPSEDALQITYDYNPLWLSFRPTLWIWALAAVGTVIIAVWRRPKAAAPRRVAAPKASVGLSPDHVRAFNEAYEEKNRIASELKFLEARAQKGKIPRRRYKVQRRTLEVRLDTLSKNIAELKTIFRSAGGIYADLVRQLDIAETELVEVATNIRTIEVRHRRGELSLEDYKKSLADYQRRKEKAETTINGILLRLREEIH
jgi:hypothetical protein